MGHIDFNRPTNNCDNSNNNNRIGYTGNSNNNRSEKIWNQPIGCENGIIWSISPPRCLVTGI